MRVYPAIDLLDGACVRLYRGSYDRVTEFSRDPAAVAERFVEEGARALHVVDLDGAREGRPVQLETVLGIARSVPVPVQVGGGLRSDEAVARCLDGGVRRVVLGTGAVRDPDWLGALVARFGPARVAAGVDVEDGTVMAEAWREGSGVPLEAHLEALEARGVRTVVYTDTTRDGTLTAPDVEGARTVVERGFRTLAAGGISRPEHLSALREAGVAGAVVGRALYEGGLTLAEARAAAGDRGAPGPGDGG